MEIVITARLKTVVYADFVRPWLNLVEKEH